MARPWIHPTHLGRSKKCLWAPLGCQDPSKMEANLGSQKSFFEAQVGLHFGGVLAAMWRHIALFWRPKLSSLLGGSKLATDPFKAPFSIEISSKMDQWPTWTPPTRSPTWASKKMLCGAQGPPRPPPKWRPTWASKIDFWDPKLASMLGGSWRPMPGPRSIF